MASTQAELAQEIRPLSCQERGCQMTVFRRLDRPTYVYQHGENPEAILEVDMFHRGLVYTETIRLWWNNDLGGIVPASVVEDWAQRIHEYEVSGSLEHVPPSEQEV